MPRYYEGYGGRAEAHYNDCVCGLDECIHDRGDCEGSPDCSYCMGDEAPPLVDEDPQVAGSQDSPYTGENFGDIQPPVTEPAPPHVEHSETITDPAPPLPPMPPHCDCIRCKYYRGDVPVLTEEEQRIILAIPADRNTAPTCGCTVTWLDDWCPHCRNCFRHCQCYLCNNCTKWYQNRDESRPYCNSCGMCRDCCRCYTCPACGNQRSGNEVVRCSTCHKCRNGCCVCRLCSICNHFFDRSEFTCSTCKSCITCCQCGTCPDCRRMYRQVCRDCHRCSSCCDAFNCYGITGRESAVTLYKYPITFHDAAHGAFKTNTSRRHLSCELEINLLEPAFFPARVLRQALKKWKDTTVSDGSIGSGLAFEINTQPSQGDVFIQHITELCDAMNDMRMGCDPRCGVHVHVNCKPINGITEGVRVYDLRSIILLYNKVERALFELCLPRRLDAQYSKICGFSYMKAAEFSKPDEFKGALLSRLYNGQKPLPPKGDHGMKEKQHTKYRSVRYRALNIHSYFLRGTVEFRHKEGTIDAQEIINWSLVCANLLDSALSMGVTKIEALPHGQETLLKVVPESLHQWMKDKWRAYPGMCRTLGLLPAAIWQEHPTSLHIGYDERD